LQISLEHPDERVARFVLGPARELLGAPVVLLGTDEVGTVEVEVLGEDLAAGLRWRTISPAADRALRVPWARPGWYVATCDVIDAALGEIGRRRTGPVRQARHWSISAIMEVPTDSGSLWFKQVPGLFAHEGRLSAWLHERVPGAVPKPVYVGPDWWLAEAFGPESREVSGMDHFQALGMLQRESVGHGAELLALGCPDRRLPLLLPELFAASGRPLLTEEQWSALERSRPQLEHAVEVLAGAGLPDTLVHGDFHAGNVRGSDVGWTIYDWTDGCLSHPLLDLQPAWSLHAWTGATFDAGVEAWWPAHRCAPQIWSAAACVGLAHQLVSHLRITAAVETAAGQTWREESRRWADRLLVMLA